MEQTLNGTSPYMAKVNEMRAAMSDSEREAFNDALVAEAQALIEKGDRMIDSEIKEVRSRLGDTPEIVSMSYIAKNYFGKSRTWLYQRINGNKVNGKPVFFTRAERRQLQEALHDIGQKLSAITLL